MRLVLAVSATGLLLLSSVMNLEKVSQSGHLDQSSPAPEFLTVAVAMLPKMWADNALLYQGEVLKINFETPHAQYFGVIDPSGHFFYVVFPTEKGDVSKLKSFVNSKDFAALPSLSIHTSTFTADPYTYGVLENQPVFTKTGTYRFVLGDNLHVDDESMLGILKIAYRHTARPQKADSVSVDN